MGRQTKPATSWVRDAGGGNVYQQQIALKLGESWVWNSISEEIILFTEQSGDVRRIFWIKTQCKLNVSMKCDCTKKLFLPWDLWPELKVGEGRSWLSLLTSKEICWGNAYDFVSGKTVFQGIPSCGEGEGMDAPVMLESFVSTSNHCRSAGLSAFVMLLWDHLWIWVSRCCLSRSNSLSKGLNTACKYSGVLCVCSESIFQLISLSKVRSHGWVWHWLL